MGFSLQCVIGCHLFIYGRCRCWCWSTGQSCSSRVLWCSSHGHRNTRSRRARRSCRPVPAGSRCGTTRCPFARSARPTADCRPHSWRRSGISRGTYTYSQGGLSDKKFILIVTDLDYSYFFCRMSCIAYLNSIYRLYAVICAIEIMLQDWLRNNKDSITYLFVYLFTDVQISKYQHYTENK